MTFLFIEHDMEVVMGHSDRVIVMAEGRVIADGAPDEVRSDQAVIDAYLGARSPDGGIGAARLRAPTAVTARCSSPRASSPATCPRWTS